MPLITGPGSNCTGAITVALIKFLQLVLVPYLTALAEGHVISQVRPHLGCPFSTCGYSCPQEEPVVAESL